VALLPDFDLFFECTPLVTPAGNLSVRQCVRTGANSLQFRIKYCISPMHDTASASAGAPATGSGPVSDSDSDSVSGPGPVPTPASKPSDPGRLCFRL